MNYAMFSRDGKTLVSYGAGLFTKCVEKYELSEQQDRELVFEKRETRAVETWEEAYDLIMEILKEEK